MIRSTTDSFHRPRDVRPERGLTAADGYFLDSHQLDRIVSELLIPFQQGADEVLISAFDEPTDTTLESVVGVPSNAVLVFDGLFLHRESSQTCGICRSTSTPMIEGCRMGAVPARRSPLDRTSAGQNSTIDSRPPGGPGTDTVGPPTCHDFGPRCRATVVVDNNDLAHPRYSTLERSRSWSALPALGALRPPARPGLVAE